MALKISRYTGQNNLPPVHPGRIIKRELDALAMSGREFERRIKVTNDAMSRVIRGKRKLTADDCIRLSLFFGTTPEFWMNLQTDYEYKLAEKKHKDIYKKIRPYKKKTEPVERTLIGDLPYASCHS